MVVGGLLADAFVVRNFALGTVPLVGEERYDMLDARYTLFNCWAAAAKAEHMGPQNRLLAAIATLVVVALPLCELIALAGLLLVPMQNVDHRRWRSLCLWTENFSCLDVFLLALFATKVEVPRLSHAINQHFACEVEILPAAIVCAVGACIIGTLRSILMAMHLTVLDTEEHMTAVCEDGGGAAMMLLPADDSHGEPGVDLQHSPADEWVGRASSPTIHILGVRNIGGDIDGNVHCYDAHVHSKQTPPVVIGHL